MINKRQNSMENEQEVIEPSESENDESVNNQENEIETLRKKVKTLEAQKEHFRAKALKPKEEVLTNNNQQGISKDEIILYAKGYSEDEVNLALKIAKIEDTTPLKALESDIFKAKMDVKKQKELSEKAQIDSVSHSASFGGKGVRELTPEEHKQAYFKTLRDNGIEI